MGLLSWQCDMVEKIVLGVKFKSYHILSVWSWVSHLTSFYPLLMATGEAIPLRGLEGVPGLPGAPQGEAGLTRKFETSHVGG